jgi:hypothetical protein
LRKAASDENNCGFVRVAVSWRDDFFSRSKFRFGIGTPPLANWPVRQGPADPTHRHTTGQGGHLGDQPVVQTLELNSEPRQYPIDRSENTACAPKHDNKHKGGNCKSPLRAALGYVPRSAPSETTQARPLAAMTSRSPRYTPSCPCPRPCLARPATSCPPTCRLTCVGPSQLCNQLRLTFAFRRPLAVLIRSGQSCHEGPGQFTS